MCVCLLRLCWKSVFARVFVRSWSCCLQHSTSTPLANSCSKQRPWRTVCPRFRCHAITTEAWLQWRNAKAFVFPLNSCIAQRKKNKRATVSQHLGLRGNGTNGGKSWTKAFWIFLTAVANFVFLQCCHVLNVSCLDIFDFLMMEIYRNIMKYHRFIVLLHALHVRILPPELQLESLVHLGTRCARVTIFSMPNDRKVTR